jgi:hypothetical protein
MAMLEAMSYGVVPIASNGIGAMRWLVTSGYDGYICHLDRWPAQALDCLLQLTATPEMLDKMKSRVRQKFLSDFTIERVADRLLDLLQSPTVDRSKHPNRIKILRWHRNSPDLAKPTIVERLCFRFGILRYDGWLQLNHDS